MKDPTRFKCVECGKLTAGRISRDGRHKGDMSARFPRRHRLPTGDVCPGVYYEAEWVIPAAGVRRAAEPEPRGQSVSDNTLEVQMQGEKCLVDGTEWTANEPLGCPTCQDRFDREVRLASGSTDPSHPREAQR